MTTKYEREPNKPKEKNESPWVTLDSTGINHSKRAELDQIKWTPSKIPYGATLEMNEIAVGNVLMRLGVSPPVYIREQHELENIPPFATIIHTKKYKDTDQIEVTEEPVVKKGAQYDQSGELHIGIGFQDVAQRVIAKLPGGTRDPQFAERFATGINTEFIQALYDVHDLRNIIIMSIHPEFQQQLRQHTMSKMIASLQSIYLLANYNSLTPEIIGIGALSYFLLNLWGWGLIQRRKEPQKRPLTLIPPDDLGIIKYEETIIKAMSTTFFRARKEEKAHLSGTVQD